MAVKHFFYSQAEDDFENKWRPLRPRRFCELADGRVLEYTSSRAEKEKGVIPVHNWDDARYLGYGQHHHESARQRQAIQQEASA